MAKRKQNLQKQINAKLGYNPQKAKTTYSGGKKKKVVKKVRKNNTVNITNKPIKSVTKVQKSEPKLIKIEKTKSTNVNKTNKKSVKQTEDNKETKLKKAKIKKLEKELNKEIKKTQKKLEKEQKKKLKKEKVPKEKKQEKKPKSRKKIYILFFLVAIILIALLVIGITKNNHKIFFDFKAYKIGDEVVLENDSKWYVIDDSGIDKQDISLLSATILDINKDNKYDDNDKIAFDSDNQTEYTTKNDKNIGYFLNEKAKEILNIKEAKEVRLLTSEEYIKIRRTMEFGYDWKEGNWLAGKDLGSWWLKTTKYNKIYVVNERGSYKLSNANSKNYVRVVIKVNKSIIKQN